METNNALNIAKKIFDIYVPTYNFPSWVLEPNLWNTFEFDKTIVYYDREENLHDVINIVREREPCNIGMKRIYFKETLRNEFGWEYGAYNRSTIDKLMPNIAIYCYATVLLPSGYKKIHVINLVGYAFDTLTQPDYQYFKSKSTEHLIEKYNKMWRKALNAAVDLKKNGLINNIQIFNVGGGAFAPPDYDNFIETIFEPAFLPLSPYFKNAGIKVIGYDREEKVFNGGYIPQILSTDEYAEETLYVNAWDPWSMIGNGNDQDNSLDGHWGRCSNMAVLGWPETNPFLNYRAI